MTRHQDAIARTCIRLHNRVTAALALALAGSIAGCGTIPDATVHYYLAKTDVSFKVTRTVSCDSKNHPIVSTTVLPAVAHSAASAASAVQIKQLRGTFSDSDVKFDFYEDGRLKGVNATTTGQGDSILKAVTTLAGSIAAFSAEGDAPTFPTQCQFIKTEGGGKPLSLTYESKVDTASKVNQNIEPDASSKVYARMLEPAIGEICAKVESTGIAAIPVKYEPKTDELVLWAQQPGWATILVSRSISGGLCAPTSPFWHDQVAVAQLGARYPIPLPSPELFGKEAFVVAFAESGALTSLQYTSTNGSAQALGSLNSLVTATQGESAATKAADIKAQADLIAQQQRLTACRADPATCK